MTNNWKEFYDAIRDPVWPDCDNIADFVTLPDVVKLEIVRDYLFNKNNNTSNFLQHAENVMQIIGSDNTSMTYEDVIFMYSILRSAKPNHVLEIGRAHGWSTSIIFSALEDNNKGHVTSIDIVEKTNPVVRSLISSRTTFVTADSRSLLSLDPVKDIKFEVVFIDGDHSYYTTLADLKNSKKLSTDEAWFLVHDDNMPQVRDAIDAFVKLCDNIVDCGTYGSQLTLLHKIIKDTK